MVAPQIIREKIGLGGDKYFCNMLDEHGEILGSFSFSLSTACYRRFVVMYIGVFMTRRARKFDQMLYVYGGWKIGWNRTVTNFLLV